MTDDAASPQHDLSDEFEKQHGHLPPRGSVIERVAGRVIPMDERGWVLLMQGFEPAAPERLFWFTIGGGIDDGETTRAAACRELAEEAGVVVDETSLGDPVHTWVHEFSFAHRSIVQHEETYAVALPSDTLVDLSGLDATEVMTTARLEWIDPARLADGSEQAGPATLLEQIEAVRVALSITVNPGP